MKRLSFFLLAGLIALLVVGCGEDKEKKFSQDVEISIQNIETRLDSAIQTKKSVEANFKTLNTTTAQLRDEISELQSSIDQLDASLNDLQVQVNALRSTQSEFKKVIQGGSGFLKWFIFIIVVLLIIYMIIKFLKQPKPFDEDEEEDFSAFDEELGYDEPGEDFGDETEAKKSDD